MAEQEFQISERELVQAASDAAALLKLSELEDEARQLALASRADSTWRAYDNDLRHFPGLVLRAPLNALPAELLTTATYLAALESSHSPSTIRRRLAAIGVSHQLTGRETPTADISLSESYQLTPAQAGGSGEDHLRPKPTWHQEAGRQTVQNRGYSEQVQALVFIAGWMTDEGESIQQLLEAEAFADSLVPAALRSVPFKTRTEARW